MASQEQGTNVVVSSQRSLGQLAPFQYRVLSIQSCVTYGYVGNKSAMFPLQLIGVDVDPVHTVTLSNHAGYPVVKGHRSTKEDLSNIFAGLEGNQMHLSYDLILSGYLGNAEAANAVATQLESWLAPHAAAAAAAEGSSPVSLRRSTVLQRWLAGRPSDRRNRLLYVCDPVLGDNGKLYVANDVVESYRSRLLRHADVVLPNGFEASLLSSLPLHSLSTAAAVAEYFHKVHGVPLVIIKSFHDKERFPLTDANNLLPSMLTMYVSCSPHSIGGGSDECSPETFALDVPLMEGQYSGTGDLFASLFLGYLLEPGRTLKEAVLCSVRSMQDILRATKQASASLPPPEQQLRALELRFLQHSALLLNPSNDSTVVIVEKE